MARGPRDLRGDAGRAGASRMRSQAPRPPWIRPSTTSHHPAPSSSSAGRNRAVYSISRRTVSSSSGCIRSEYLLLPAWRSASSRRRSSGSSPPVRGRAARPVWQRGDESSTWSCSCSSSSNVRRGAVVSAAATASRRCWSVLQRWPSRRRAFFRIRRAGLSVPCGPVTSVQFRAPSSSRAGAGGRGGFRRGRSPGRQPGAASPLPNPGPASSRRRPRSPGGRSR